MYQEIYHFLGRLRAMGALSNALGTVRSTVIVVVLLASTFIVFDSYKWKPLSVSWSQPSFAPSHSESQPIAAPNTPAPTSETTPSNVVTPDPLFDEDYAGDERDDGDISSVNSKPKNDDDESQFKESDKSGTASSFQDAPDSTERTASTVTGGSEKEDLTIHRRERPGSSSIADAGSTAAPPKMSSEIMTPPRGAQPTREKPTRSYDELSSVEKVELDLWQARSTMRRVVRSQINPTNAAAERSFPGGEPRGRGGEPRGDVYRDAAIFRQSYEEMEQRFKVFRYKEGEEPLVHNGPCKNIYAIEGRFIQELQGDNSYVTTDPEEAHVFFLPFSVAMMVTYLYTSNSGDMSPLLRFAKDYVNVVSRKYPYWNRSEGADHFMLACHDWGPHVSRADDKLVSKAIRVLCNANASEGYVSTKDASLPEINLVGGEIPTELGGIPASERKILAFFAGGDHGPVRPELFKHWEEKDSDILVYHQVPAEGPSYHAYMKSSKYCLCPSGYEVNSPRIVEAIYNDCVPVVIADKFVLPFSDVLDWNMFAVHVLEQDIPSLKTILETIPMQTYIEMQARVKQVRHHFILNKPPESIIDWQTLTDSSPPENSTPMASVQGDHSTDMHLFSEEKPRTFARQRSKLTP